MAYLNLFLNYINFELMCHEAMMQDLECLQGYEEPNPEWWEQHWADEQKFEESLRCDRPYTKEEDIPF